MCEKTGKISIIVPVYNAEKTLERCVTSLINQTYENIEIILVNDGSKDNSLDLCKKFEAQDSRIVVIDKPNGGVSSARNAGLDIATGEFVMFCDSDDIVVDRLLELMLFNYQHNDLLMCEIVEFNEDDKIAEKVGNLENITFENIPKQNFIKYRNQGLGSTTNKLFCADIINKNNIKFSTDISLGEDLVFVLDYCSHIDGNITFMHAPLYMYRKIESESLSKSVPSIEQTCALYDLISSFFHKFGVDSIECKELFYKMIIYDFEKLLIKLICTQHLTYKEKRRECKKVFDTVAYSNCCKQCKISANKIYQWALSNKAFYLLYLIVKLSNTR